MKKIFVLFLCALLLSGCSDMSNMISIQGNPDRKPWTILIYMAADNDLESAAIFDINELESVPINDSKYSILVLVDRAEGWDGTNGNWTDTRLYKIKRDPQGINGTIISQRLSCPELDLSAETQTELNMSDPNTLRGFISFAMREYFADRYALIMWGHGTGWRSANVANAKNKAVAIDDYNGTYMDLPSLKTALNGIYFDIIGFDTCFGATLETAYEISNSAEYLAASSGIIPTAGWNYADIFSRFNPNMSASDFCDIIVDSFSLQYAFEASYSISKIFLPAIKSAAQAFCAFTQSCANTITTAAERNEILSLFMNSTQKECAPVYPSDMFLDAADVTAVLNKYVQNSALESGIKTDVQQKADAVLAAINTSVVQTMRGGKKESPALSVFFTALEAPGVCSPVHPSAYVKDSGVLNQSSFVKNTSGWTPTANARGSLLDKIFYTSF